MSSAFAERGVGEQVLSHTRIGSDRSSVGEACPVPLVEKVGVLFPALCPVVVEDHPAFSFEGTDSRLTSDGTDRTQFFGAEAVPVQQVRAVAGDDGLASLTCVAQGVQEHTGRRRVQCALRFLDPDGVERVPPGIQVLPSHGVAVVGEGQGHPCGGQVPPGDAPIVGGCGDPSPNERGSWLMRISLLDRSRTRAGESDAAALATTIERAVRAEELGLHRFWTAEHHAVPGIAGAAPAVLLAAIGARTRSIRLGTGGIMVPNHSPLVIAEQALLLEALSPGRIDLGLGGSLGFTAPIRRALGRTALHEGEYPADIEKIRRYLSGRAEVTARPSVEPPPYSCSPQGAGCPSPPIWDFRRWSEGRFFVTRAE